MSWLRSESPATAPPARDPDGSDVELVAQARLGDPRAFSLLYRRYLDQGGDPAIKLVLAGVLPTHDSAFAPDPRRIIAELGLGDQVHCCGWVDEADKPALYALSSGFIFPSLYEGFGMMVLEAMAAGTPVITSGP